VVVDAGKQECLRYIHSVVIPVQTGIHAVLIAVHKAIHLDPHFREDDDQRVVGIGLVPVLRMPYSCYKNQIFYLLATWVQRGINVGETLVSLTNWLRYSNIQISDRMSDFYLNAKWQRDKGTM
jgi:hypothetical protein